MAQDMKPIWVESLLTPQEWKENRRIYKTTASEEPPQMFEGDFKWRYGMGAFLSKDEIQLINKRIDAVLKLVNREQQ